MLLVRLLAMNWVEKRYARKQAIADGMEPLWIALCNDVTKAVEAFNNLYRPEPKKQVDITLAADLLLIGLVLPLVRREQREEIKRAIAAVQLDRINQIATCTYTYSKKSGATIMEFGQDGSGNVILTVDGNEVDTDEASRLILEEFLFTLPTQ